MKILKLSIILCCICILRSKGQEKVYSDTMSITTYVSLKGDVIKNECDSLYILNPKTYKIYETALLNIHRKANVDKAILGYYQKSLQLTLNRIDEQSKEYVELKTITTTLLTDSKQFVQNTSEKLSRVNENLTTATNTLNNVNSKLDAAIESIKEAKKDRWKLLGTGRVRRGSCFGVSISDDQVI